MKKNVCLVLLSAVLVLFFVSCSNSVEGTDSTEETYSFADLYGHWTRSGSVGAMGITYLTVNENLMEWQIKNNDPLYYTYTEEKQKTNVYTVKWYAYDPATGTSSPDIAMRLTIAFEGASDIYIITDASGMGGITMERK